MADKAKSGFIWYELMTGDVEKAAAFYGAVVGWAVRDSGMPGMKYLIFGSDGKDVGGMMSSTSMGAEKPTKWRGHIHTADVDAETKAVVADGGKQHRPPTEAPGVGRFAVVSDPQGAEFLLFQPNPGEEPARLGPMEVGSVGWKELTTSDWERAWRFYASHYGWTKDMAVEMGPMGTYQTFQMESDRDGGGMMNTPKPKLGETPEPAWIFYFTVEDIQAAAQRVRDHGGSLDNEPRQVPGGSWAVHATDSQGGRFALTAAK